MGIKGIEAFKPWKNEDIDCPKCGKRMRQELKNYRCLICGLLNPHEWWKPDE